MENKDIITLSISVCAFALSAFATIYSFLKAVENRKRTIRDLLTNVLDKLITTQINTLDLLNKNEENKIFTLRADALAMQKVGFLLEQAIFLSKQIPNHIQIFELNTLACICQDLGRFQEAEEYAHIAINKSRTPLETALTKGAFASLLFLTARHDEGRKEYREAIALIQDRDNQSLKTRGNIFFNWAQCESDYAGSTENAHE